MPSNPGHVIVLCGYAVRCVAVLTKHNHSELYEHYGGVINQTSINYVTSMCSYASTRHTRETRRLTTGDDVRLDLTIAHLSQCPVYPSSAYFTSPEDRKLNKALHFTMRQQLMLTYLHTLQYEKRQPSLQAAVGSTELLSV
jgi:hypothetical protein